VSFSCSTPDTIILQRNLEGGLGGDIRRPHPDFLHQARDIQDMIDHMCTKTTELEELEELYKENSSAAGAM
jgi:3-polyprenyl-4-hydroxybenzoate decarboxylase